MNRSRSSKPRLVIYGVGQYGGHVARFAAEKGWPIVAAFNRAGPKVGQDLGRVIGLGRDIGVIVQDCDAADYTGIQADVAIVAQTNILRVNLPAYRRLLGARLNVLCHGSESYYPYGNDPEAAAEIDALAKRNGVTFTGGGIWDMSRIWAGILVAGPCTQIESLYHSSITDAHGQAATKDHARLVGIGFTVPEFHAKGLDRSPLAKSYLTIPEQVLVTLGCTVTSKAARIEPVTFDAPIYSALMEGEIAAGDVVGTRIVGDLTTREGPTARVVIELRLFREGEVEHMFWSVEGKPRTSIRTERKDSAHATAANLFNRIPDVIAAPPGIVTVAQMGPVRTSAFA